MSPLQYQKRIRLNEARRMMLTEHIDASRAAFEVGYESPSQFSREYSRQFGAAPMRDIKKLIQAATPKQPNSRVHDCMAVAARSLEPVSAE